MNVWIAVAFLFLLGLSVGSFVNVLIYRVPRRESVFAPPSHCPNCDTRIKWYDNIPLLSFVLLRGRCRACQERISLRYPVVELSGGVLFVAVFFKIAGISSLPLTYPVIAELAAGLLFVTVLLAIAYIDAEHQIIPNRIMYPALILGPILLIIAAPANALTYLIGFAIGGGLLLVLALIKPAGMGAGDVKLAAFMGLFLGWQILLALFVGFLTGAVVGVIVALVRRRSLKEPIAFGPFLALGGLLAYFYGVPLTNLYLRTFT